MEKHTCKLANRRSAYEHYYSVSLCGSTGNSSEKQPEPVMKVTATNASSFAAEEPLAEWEKDLLKPDPNQVVHIYPAEGMTACDIKLDDGKTHAVNSNIEAVSCGDCKINYLNYVNVEQHRQIEALKEKVRVFEQATTMVRRDLRNARRRIDTQAITIRSLRQDVEYLRGGPQYYVDPHTGRSRPRY